MNLRRRTLCLGSAAVALAASCPSFAVPKPTPRSAVFGLGGAGCNLVEKLRGRDAVHTVTVDIQYKQHKRRRVDLTLSDVAGRSLSTTDASRVRDAVRPFDFVLLVAGLGACAGTFLIAHFAEAARAHGASVGAVVILPLGLEGNRSAVARSGLSTLSLLVDSLTTIDNDVLADELFEQVPDLEGAGIPLCDIYNYADEYALRAVATQLRAARDKRFSVQPAWTLPQHHRIVESHA